jgi:cytochrome c biogenesis protein CcmG/thiol:disulfide interchange protein DsbE
LSAFAKKFLKELYMVRKLRIQNVIVMFFCLVFISACSTTDDGKVLAGPAPNFTLEDISGKSLSLSDIKGKVVIVDFWATWCGPCLSSIPELVDLQEKYKAKGLVIVGISVDDDKVSKGELVAFREKMRINYPILRANNKVYEDYFGRTSGFSIPTLFVIDREGKVRDRVVGFRPGVVEKTVQSLL